MSRYVIALLSWDMTKGYTYIAWSYMTEHQLDKEKSHLPYVYKNNGSLTASFLSQTFGTANNLPHAEISHSSFPASEPYHMRV